MSEKRELNQEELNKVSGGNHGDKAKEYSATPDQVKYLYKVDQHVEVFIDTLIHIHTKGGTIIERQPHYFGDGSTKNSWAGYYKVRYDSGGEEWVSADEIERL